MTNANKSAQANTVLLIAILIVLSFGVYYLYQSSQKAPEVEVNEILEESEEADLEEETWDEVVVVEREPGFVTGKLCYPSEIVPPGIIEAKNLLTNEIFSMQTSGSHGYKLELPDGSYYLRFRAQPNADNPDETIDGYHTTVCPTGLETTCVQTNPRENIEVVVKSGQTASKVDLCDFYFSDADEANISF